MSNGITIQISRNGAVTELSRSGVTESEVGNRDIFRSAYRRYCVSCGIPEDMTDRGLDRAWQGEDAAGVRPWWTTQMVQLLDHWLNRQANEEYVYRVELRQFEELYLCQVTRRLADGWYLSEVPVLAHVKDRLLEPYTIRNYLYWLASVTGSDSEEQDIVTALRNHAVVFELKLEGGPDGATLQLSLDPKASRVGDNVERGFKSDARSFRIESAPGNPRGSQILLSSRSVRAILPRLGAAWQGHAPCTALFLAPSGGGKEVLKDFFCAGLAPLVENRIRAVSLAGLNPEQCQMLLFGLGAKEGTSGVLPQLAASNKPGFLFVDEIHQADTAVRASLLRVLESGEIPAPRGGDLDAKKIFYSFAASCVVPALRKLAPPDFWNRIEHLIEMEHPLVGPLDERRRTCCDYIEMFFASTVKQVVSDQLGEGHFGKLISSSLLSGIEDSANVGLITEVTQEAAEYIAFLRPGTVSVRHLRAIAKGLAISLVESIFGRGEYEQAGVHQAVRDWVSGRVWRSLVIRRIGEITSSV